MWLKLRAVWPPRDTRQRPLPNCDPLNALGVVGVGGGVVSEGNGSGGVVSEGNGSVDG